MGWAEPGSQVPVSQASGTLAFSTWAGFDSHGLGIHRRVGTLDLDPHGKGIRLGSHEVLVLRKGELDSDGWDPHGRGTCSGMA